MKKSELFKEVEALGLNIETGNQFPNHIAQIWTNYSKSTGKVESTDGKIYTTTVLSLKEITTLNLRFKKLVDICHKNNLYVDAIHTIESNLISEIIVVVKNETQMNGHVNIDFELDNTLTDRKQNYEFPRPKYNTPYNLLFKDKLTKPELKKIEDTLEERINSYSLGDAIYWLYSLCINSNYSLHLKKVFNDNLITPYDFVENLFLQTDKMYLDHETEFFKLFTILSRYKIENISLSADKNKRGYLPDVIINNSTIFRNILTNWTFTEQALQANLDSMISDELEPQFIRFMNAYSPVRLSLYDHVAQVINIGFNFKTVEIFFKKWVNFKDYSITESIELMKQIFSNQLRDKELKKLLLDTIIRDEIVPLDELYKTVVSTLSNLKYNSVTNVRHQLLLEPFINDNTLDFTYYDCFIVKVYFNIPKFKEKFLSNSDITSALLHLGDEQYFPDNIKDIFLF